MEMKFNKGKKFKKAVDWPAVGENRRKGKESEVLTADAEERAAK
jgi:hypothetical protein